ncbi:MAG: hypothetical protein IJR68_04640 [Fretibacterium sp.]|nr:hypothetical protein [Fretibacterium sp.]
MSIWRWLKRLCFRRQRYIEITRMPIGRERASIERGWSGERLARITGRA